VAGLSRYILNIVIPEAPQGLSGTAQVERRVLGGPG
jgi:hypothetical protein